MQGQEWYEEFFYAGKNKWEEWLVSSQQTWASGTADMS